MFPYYVTDDGNIESVRFPRAIFGMHHPILYTVVICIMAVTVCFPYLIAVFLVNCYLNT